MLDLQSSSVFAVILQDFDPSSFSMLYYSNLLVQPYQSGGQDDGEDAGEGESGSEVGESQAGPPQTGIPPVKL